MTRSYARSALFMGVLLAGGCDVNPGVLGGTGGGGGRGGTNPMAGTGGSGGAPLPPGSGGSGGSGGATDTGITGADVPGTAVDASDAPSGEGGAVVPGVRRHGKSSGCGMAAGAAGAQQLSIPVCTGCSAAMGNCPRDCIAPEFAPGGASVVGGQNFTRRS
jgi:hypothetical protein